MSDELWHVQIEPGDVKKVTLEQMDDMYRLDLISASTLVWQPGMPNALPLSVVAGIDAEDDDEVMEIEPELIHEPVQLPPSLRPVAMVPPPVAGAAVASVPPAALAPTPDLYAPESLRPITMSEMPPIRRSGSGAGGKVLLGVAIAAGTLMTLHRNDLLRPMAASTGNESTYERFESALGSPGFGTTRGVAQFSAMLNPAPEPLAAAEPQTAPTPSTNTSESETAGADSATAAGAAEEVEATAKGATNDSKGRAVPARRHAPPPRKTNGSSNSKKLKAFQGSDYDPMNAKL